MSSDVLVPTKLPEPHKPINAKAWAIGSKLNGRWVVRRVVWGRLLAREEKRPSETILHALITVYE